MLQLLKLNYYSLLSLYSLPLQVWASYYNLYFLEKKTYLDYGMISTYLTAECPEWPPAGQLIHSAWNHHQSAYLYKN